MPLAAAFIMLIMELFWSVATMVSVPFGLLIRCSPRSLPGVRPRPYRRVTDVAFDIVACLRVNERFVSAISYRREFRRTGYGRDARTGSVSHFRVRSGAVCSYVCLCGLTGGDVSRRCRGPVWRLSMTPDVLDRSAQVEARELTDAELEVVA